MKIPGGGKFDLVNNSIVRPTPTACVFSDSSSIRIISEKKGFVCRQEGPNRADFFF